MADQISLVLLDVVMPVMGGDEALTHIRRIRPDVPVKLTFNVRVDAARSKLQLLMPDAATVELPIVKWSSPDTLVSKLTGLKPGAYAIRWQVLAPDGHISRGEIPFTVRNP